MLDKFLTFIFCFIGIYCALNFRIWMTFHKPGKKFIKKINNDRLKRNMKQ